LPLAFHDFEYAHLPELVDLWVESWSEVYADIDFNDRRGWFVDHLTGWAEGGDAIRLAFDVTDGTMAGFILISERSGLLDQICVSRGRKGGGVAEALMAEARRISPARILLDVNTMNARAIRFYAKQGFVQTGEGVNPRSGLPIYHYRWQP
jgi:putative acetyltransferase